MVWGADTGPFQGELVGCVQFPAPRLVAAEERILARADDELVGGIVAAAAEDCPLHGREDVGLVAARADQRERGIEGVVCKFGGAPGIGALRRALDEPPTAADIGGVDDLAGGGSSGEGRCGKEGGSTGR